MSGGSLARPRGRPGSRPLRAGTAFRQAGFSLVELLFATGVAGVLSMAAIPAMRHAIDRHQTGGAVRLVQTTLQQARTLAVARGSTVAVRFVGHGDEVGFSVHVDGDRDGVSAADVVDGNDPLIIPVRTLAGFGEARFGIWPHIMSPDGVPFPDPDPIRVGTSDAVSFTPSGTATGGSLYIRGANRQQYVIRIDGDTGRTRVLRYLETQRSWGAM
ncbi:MAG: GspH/FimT family pseudopilin [Vicinamibacterales bacterium]